MFTNCDKNASYIKNGQFSDNDQTSVYDRWFYKNEEDGKFGYRRGQVPSTSFSPTVIDKEVERYSLVHIDDLPLWLNDNEFLLCGHRPPLNSYYACFDSIFKIHTETGNIWTHMIGFLTFILLAVLFLYKPIFEMPVNDILYFILFFVGSILCFGFSWIYHMVQCHSEVVAKRYKTLDYCGISLVIVGSANLWLHYFLYCKIYQQIFYISMVSFLGIIGLCISLMRVFAAPRFKFLRAIIFVILGLSGALSCLHFGIDEGFDKLVSNISFIWLLRMAMVNVTGACFYAFHVPERFSPRKFNFWFQSHQIFHILVVVAAVIHLIGMVEVAHYRHVYERCPSSSNFLVPSNKSYHS